MHHLGRPSEMIYQNNTAFSRKPKASADFLQPLHGVISALPFRSRLNPTPGKLFSTVCLSGAFSEALVRLLHAKLLFVGAVRPVHRTCLTMDDY